MTGNGETGTAVINTNAQKDSPEAIAAKFRSKRNYPSGPFEDSLSFAKAIFRYAPAGKIRRLTLFENLNKSPTSSSSQMLITNANKYGLIKGNYKAEHIELTVNGRFSVDESELAKAKRAQFDLAIYSVAPFKHLYDEYCNKRLAARDVLRDALEEIGVPKELTAECVDLFLVNLKFLGLFKTIAGSETVIPIEQILEELPASAGLPVALNSNEPNITRISSVATPDIDFEKICFYVSPIGEDGEEQRKHSDLFLGSIVEPALRELGLVVVRADQIGSAGMITAQIIQYVLNAKLVVVDMSWHNPNAFYEMCLRHVSRKPIVQICRKADKLPFDVGQARTVVIDTTDIYSLVPQMEVYRSEVASQARSAIQSGEGIQNPLTTFAPNIHLVLE